MSMKTDLEDGVFCYGLSEHSVKTAISSVSIWAFKVHAVLLCVTYQVLLNNFIAWNLIWPAVSSQNVAVWLICDPSIIRNMKIFPIIQVYHLQNDWLLLFLLKCLFYSMWCSMHDLISIFKFCTVKTHWLNCWYNCVMSNVTDVWKNEWNIMVQKAQMSAALSHYQKSLSVHL